MLLIFCHGGNYIIAAKNKKQTNKRETKRDSIQKQEKTKRESEREG